MENLKSDSPQSLLVQHKQRNLVWSKGTDALDGELQSSSEVDFYVDQVIDKVSICEHLRNKKGYFIATFCYHTLRQCRKRATKFFNFPTKEPAQKRQAALYPFSR